MTYSDIACTTSQIQLVHRESRYGHPADGLVSLRVGSRDSSGNTVEQTIIHAYWIAQ
ncbi:hypothetical protein [Nonomuraea sp. NPDC049695]|uniref:hypothetical protein n=1 Tax=Nonomuraea sp. NPDC049695 TaxID=3154734 RepID=UPI00342C14C7